ncbi:MAG: copper resistance system multicopper oxidase [Alphaproteobacteria bacterium]
MRWHALAVLLLLPALPAAAGTYDLTVAEAEVRIDGTPRRAVTINGQVPGPELRFREGEEVTINVTNRLAVDTSIHWHGLILPYTMDGVPGMSFPGIKPGETFTYRFTVRQSGTYWYHSHSGMQEQSGMYGPMVIEPKGREPFKADREYTLLLSDWTDEAPETVLANLKKRPDYYNYGQRTLGTFLDDMAEKGFAATMRDRLDWGEMRMMPTDIADVSGYTFLVNGKAAAENWTALFQPGERVRLRIINGSAMSFFDLRIPGLKMTVVQADGNNVQPVPVDELRIAVAETYDVIVRPEKEEAYTILAEAMDRSGYARATLAPRPGMAAEVPALRPRPLLTMADMGMAHEGMDHGQGSAAAAGEHAGHGAGHKVEKAGYAPGSGLAPKAADGGRVLVYGDLRAMQPYADYRPPDREIVLRLTGNMERYIWSFDGVKYSEAEPIRLRLGERVRFTFVNTTMMTHPMHLHGMWMQLDNGAGRFSPLKHVVNVAPGTTLSVDVPVDAMGKWAFHCHLLYHMEAGMFRMVVVEDAAGNAVPMPREGEGGGHAGHH